MAGLWKKESKNFTNHQYESKENDSIYLTTDGFEDQFWRR